MNFFKNLFSKKKEEKEPYIFGRVFQNGDTGIKINFDLLYQIYQNNTTVKACIREWQDLIGSGGYKVVDPRSKRELKQLKNKVDELLNWHGEEIQTWETLRRSTWKDLGICGNAFWYFVKNISGSKVLGFKRVDPRTMSIVADEFGKVHAYIQKTGNHEAIVFEADEILHFKLGINTENELFGESPLYGLIYDTLADTEAVKTNYHFFLNDARPSTFFLLDRTLSQENTKKAIEQIRSQVQGSKNSGRAITMKGIEKIETFELTRHEMQFLEGRAFTREKVCEAYGVPAFILGITEKVNNNNGEQLREQFYDDTIKTKESQFASFISIGGLERLGFTGQFIFNEQSFNKTQRREEAQKEYEAGLITMREFKERLGYEITTADRQAPHFEKHIFLRSPTDASTLEEQPKNELDNVEMQA